MILHKTTFNYYYEFYKLLDSMRGMFPACPLEDIHKHYEPETLIKRYWELQNSINSKAVFLTKYFLMAKPHDESFPHPKRPFWINATSNLRFIVPRSYVAEMPENIRWRFKGHPIHIDSLYNLPVNNINIWLLFTQATKENTMVLFNKQNEEVYFTGGPGDAYLFSSDYPHKTVENHTDKTRITLTLRFCLERPRFRTGAQRYYWSPTAGTPLKRVFKT